MQCPLLDLPEQQKQGIETQIQWSGKLAKISPVFAVILSPIALLFYAAIFWIGTLLMQSKATFSI